MHDVPEEKLPPQSGKPPAGVWHQPAPHTDHGEMKELLSGKKARKPAVWTEGNLPREVTLTSNDEGRGDASRRGQSEPSVSACDGLQWSFCKTLL